MGCFSWVSILLCDSTFDFVYFKQFPTSETPTAIPFAWAILANGSVKVVFERGLHHGILTVRHWQRTPNCVVGLSHLILSCFKKKVEGVILHDPRTT